MAAKTLSPRPSTVTVIIIVPVSPAFGQAVAAGRGGGGCFDLFCCKGYFSLQVFAYTRQKVPLRHSKLCHLNSECTTIHVKDGNQYCITIPGLWVRQVGQCDDSRTRGPSSPRVWRVTHKRNYGAEPASLRSQGQLTTGK